MSCGRRRRARPPDLRRLSTLLTSRALPRAQRPDRTIEPLQPPFALPLPLDFVRSRRAKRISLRLDVAGSRVILVAPQAMAKRHVLDFLVRHEGWLNARIGLLPQPVRFADGVTVPLLGIPHRIQGDSLRLRGLVSRADQTIIVPGAAEHLPRRLTDFLKREAKREIERRANEKAARLGRPYAAITLRDTRSRWGSCSATGRLAFSWRLVLTPEWVLDYVVAHEVAHLAEMNHGPRFWRLCASLTESDPKKARDWLKRHGPELHAYG
jgi:predicted metal-dependent hydrolase